MARRSPVASLRKRQNMREAELIAGMAICTIPNDKGLDDIDGEVLKNKLNREFYNANLLEALACRFEVVIQLPDLEGLPKSTSDLLGEYLKNLRQIGQDSVEGVALSTGINKVKDLIIIKAPRRPEYDGLLHEYFIGTLLDKERIRVPNVMYTFAGFRCSAPEISKNKIVTRWCEPKTPIVNYVIFEKINGRDLGTNVKTKTTKEYLSTIIQIAIALMILLEKLAFTHGDLHDGNVLEREVPDGENGFYIPYETALGKWLVWANKVATIIDFGRCHVKYKGEHFGFFGLESSGLYPDRARPLYDLYKLIGFSLYSMMSLGNLATLTKVQQLLAFFRPQIKVSRNMADLKRQLTATRQLLDREIETYFEFSQQVTKEEQETSLLDFLRFVETTFPEEWAEIVKSEVENDELVLSCKGLVTRQDKDSVKCGDVETEIDVISTNPSILVQDDDNSDGSLVLVPSDEVTGTTDDVETRLRSIQSMERRLIDIEATKKDLANDVEYNTIKTRLSKDISALKDSAGALRQDLLQQLAVQKRKIDQLYQAYTMSPIELDITITDDPQANTESLISNYDMLMPLLALMGTLKRYGANLYTLKRLDEVYGKGKDSDKASLKLSPEMQARLTEDIDALSTYLNNLRPLTDTGETLKLNMMNQIAWYTR